MTFSPLRHVSTADCRNGSCRRGGDERPADCQKNESHSAQYAPAGDLRSGVIPEHWRRSGRLHSRPLGATDATLNRPSNEATGVTLNKPS